MNIINHGDFHTSHAETFLGLSRLYEWFSVSWRHYVRPKTVLEEKEERGFVIKQSGCVLPKMRRTLIVWHTSVLGRCEPGYWCQCSLKQCWRAHRAGEYRRELHLSSGRGTCEHIVRERYWNWRNDGRTGPTDSVLMTGCLLWPSLNARCSLCCCISVSRIDKKWAKWTLLKNLLPEFFEFMWRRMYLDIILIFQDSMSVQSENIPRNFFANNIQFKDTQQGKYERQCVLSDEDLRSRASQWVRENAFKKGKSNMTSPMFCEYVNNDLLLVHHLSQHFPRTISLYTAVHWLHQLGFKPVSHKKRRVYWWT